MSVHGDCRRKARLAAAAAGGLGGLMVIRPVLPARRRSGSRARKVLNGPGLSPLWKGCAWAGLISGFWSGPKTSATRSCSTCTAGRGRPS